MSLSKEQRRARRRRIVRRAVALAQEIHTEDEEARREMVLTLINQAIDIPGLTEKMERRILDSLLDLIIDLATEAKENRNG
tara:strand:- start:469 stop:711 length:243 start_codon:yes stop_codon:yes gene_type:complete